MKITAFEIENYKGITHARIDLNGNKGSIYTLVGLNESGKTTILEAINSFRPDVDGIHAIAQKSLSSDSNESKIIESDPIESEAIDPKFIQSLVPKKDKANFNKGISITATVKMTKEEIQNLADECKQEKDFQIDIGQFPQEFKISRKYCFVNSKYTKIENSWFIFPHIKMKGSRKYLTISASKNKDEWLHVLGKIRKLFPRIIYFPTFLFNFPERIQISDGESKIKANEYFKQMINDALESLDGTLNLQTHIVERVIRLEPDASFEKWYATWLKSDERESVDIALGELSQKISKEIFGPWKKVLGKKLSKKQIEIEIHPEMNEDGTRVVYLSFTIKDGHIPFKVSERSLGFRWFFCFLLFTQFFGGDKKNERIFLFDEPASNLHSAAQSALLKSLEVIADGKNDIIYSTHSHYLINPDWLETAFIVSNGELTDKNEAADADFGIENADIKAVPYRRFVGQNSEKSHYFQPILDKLGVKPSLLEATRQGVLTEGKSDYYILNWYKKHSDDPINFDFIPIGGANNAGPLISLHLGLCSNFALLLDGDRTGINARNRYLKDFPISEDAVILLSNVFDGKMKQIEDLISDTMKQVINNRYSPPEIRECPIDTKTEKGYIKMAFSEALSGKNNLPLDLETFANLKKLCDALKKAVA